MVDDRDIHRELWDGRIPVRFILSSDEQVTMDDPQPYFILVPRQTYLSLITEKLQKHFSKFIDSESDGELWVEFESQPLKWHYPFGVLYDLYGSDASLPWTLTVHFQDFPETELLHCPSREVVESHFMSCVKEADALKHRGQVINAMQKKEHKQLWTGLVNDKFDQFWAINKRLMGQNGDEDFRAIPFKLHRADRSFLQTLIKPKTEDGMEYTLQDLLSKVMPEVLEGNRFKVITQGVEPSLDTPIKWLSENFSYPDNFLHLCAISRE